MNQFLNRHISKLIIILLFVFFAPGVFNFALAREPVQIDYFYSETCPNCEKASAFLDKLEKKYPDLEITRYEILSSRDNVELLLKFFEERGKGKIIQVPAIFIGQEVIIGYLNDETTGKSVEELVKSRLGEETQNREDEIINYPLFGQINLSELSLPVLTVVLAALDGFNPCAMWVLLFLIALLVNVKSRKKMWLVGGTFISASGIVYFLLLSAWLNLFLAMSYIDLTRIVIGVLATGMGVWQLRKFATYRPGVCEVAPVGSKWHERLTQKAKEIVSSTALPATFIGIILLALGVNLIEFFCSAGLPAIYTRILSLNQLGPWSYYLYLLLYTFIFMLDDLVIFAIALVTLSKIGFTDKYSKWSTLIGGLVILLLGLLLIFKPDFLTF
ncbi:MAG: glutaredoxin [Candidatus Portnoybacteria bacterium]